MSRESTSHQLSITKSGRASSGIPSRASQVLVFLAFTEMGLIERHLKLFYSISLDKG